MRRFPVALSALVISGLAMAQTPPEQAPPPKASEEPRTHEEGMVAYHAALSARRLGGGGPQKLDDVSERAAEGEDLLVNGRVDEAIARMTELVNHPGFQPFAENEAGRAAIYTLGDALATAGAYEPARAYLRKLLQMKGAWDQAYAAYARRAVKRLVEIALESDRYEPGLKDLEGVPPSAPEETRGDVMYLTGRAKESAGDAEGAIAAYGQVPQKSRYWAQATYLAGLARVEQKRFREGEDLFCKVADPKRATQTTPVFADVKFFAVRDLARLGLGRVAHEQYRFDDSRYYYYLVPTDSERLPEALYESATSRYEKKDYEGARELLDELKALRVHHPYEDETWILDAYVDLAQCKFPDADKKLLKFIEIYEPVRDAARKVSTDDRAVRSFAEAARTGADAGTLEGIAGAKPDAMRAIAAVVRLDPAYRSIARKLAVLDHESSALRLAAQQTSDLQRSLATAGGVRPELAEGPSEQDRIEDAKAALDGVRRGIEELESMRASADQLEPLKKELQALEARVKDLAVSSPTSAGELGEGQGKDLPDLLRADAKVASELHPKIEVTRKELDEAAVLLARDALHRVDLRLSRLLRRARLGRIESVLGRKRALEVEIEAINNGILPADAIDSIDAARWLRDNEEYWPFEGDDWPDEFVGGEGLR